MNKVSTSDMPRIKGQDNRRLDHSLRADGQKDQQEYLQQYQLETLSRWLGPSIMMNLVGATTLSWIILDAVTPLLVIGWLGSVILSLFLRFGGVYLSQKKENKKDAGYWLNVQLATIAFNGLTWGACVLFVMEGSAAGLEHYIVVFLAGITAGVIATAGAHIWSALSFNVLAVVPVALYYLLSNDHVDVDYGFAMLIYLALTTYTALALYRNFIATAQQRFEAKRIAESVTRHAEENVRTLEQLTTILDQMEVGVSMYDADRHLVTWNRSFQDLFNFSDDLLYNSPTAEEMFAQFYRRHGDDATHLASHLEELNSHIQAAERDGSSKQEFSLPDGRLMDLTCHQLGDGSLVQCYMDVTDRQQANNRALVHMAQHDALTGLPNRIMFRRKLERGLDATSDGDILAVMLLDLDHFKDVNDTLGHPIGDRLLGQLGNRLRRLLSEGDFVARFGGDEFAVLIRSAKSAEEVETLATTLADEICRSVQLGENSVSVDVTIGITIYPNDAGNADQLVRNADIALNRAKRDGRNRIVIFDPSMQEEVEHRTLLQSDIRGSIDTNQFKLLYQPQIDIHTRQITGVEALMRWEHPERGQVSPADFVPIAEWSNQIVPLTEQLLPEACIQAKVWESQGLPAFQLAFNLSPLHFQEPGLVDFIRKCLDDADLPPDRLELEITEGVVMTETEVVLSTLSELDALGVKLAIDDFGTGYSSMAYLKSLPVDKLKIDQAFVRDMTHDSGIASIVEAVVNLGHSFGLKVIAEGVETADQLGLLSIMNCDQIQGYYISKPLNVMELTEWIRERYNRI
ncbi:MAG: hypothetical protein CMF31_08925 [Kordiimonas sp.]|nr:hypothetical protein [Kordiimonas sp.]|tara:strand:- start:2472 stop:4871 length:2400 start_codon:yes stop_codon:yes gene_type:complete